MMKTHVLQAVRQLGHTAVQQVGVQLKPSEEREGGQRRRDGATQLILVKLQSTVGTSSNAIHQTAGARVYSASWCAHRSDAGMAGMVPDS